MSDNVVELHPQAENLTCECGSEWWDTTVVFDRFMKRVNGFTAPRCHDCGADGVSLR